MEKSLHKINNKAMTLIELLVVAIVMSGVIVFISVSLIFFVNQTQANLERNNIYTELNYAMEDIKLRCPSAVNLSQSSKFAVPTTGYTESSEFVFLGEKDPYTITPDDMTDDVWYKYYLTQNSTDPSKTDLVLLTCSDAYSSSSPVCDASSGKKEILIDGVFSPGIMFYYDAGAPPNTLRIELTAKSRKTPLGATDTVLKTGGIRFWFIDIVK